MLTKQETLLRKGTRREQEGKGTQENCSAVWLCRVARSLGFYGDGITFQVVFGQSF